jgi:hypothetical protein
LRARVETLPAFVARCRQQQSAVGHEVEIPCLG